MISDHTRVNGKKDCLIKIKLAPYFAVYFYLVTKLYLPTVIWNYLNRVHCMQLVRDCDKEIDSVKRGGQWSPVSIKRG